MRPVVLQDRAGQEGKGKLGDLEHAEARQRETVHDDSGDVRLGDGAQLRGSEVEARQA